MEQLPQNIEQLLADLESADPAVRQAAATELGKMTVSQEHIVLALEKAASAGGSPFDGSAQAASAARAALQTPAHRDHLQRLGHQPPVQAETLTPTTNLKRLLILAGTGFVGMWLGYIVLQAAVYFVPWEVFPAPPAGTVELLTYKGGQLVSRTAEGETYDYINADERWIRSDWSKSHTGEEQGFEPCTYSQPEFGPFNNVPRDIMSCVRAAIFIPDAAPIEIIYVLDKHGQAWLWQSAFTDFGQAIAQLITRPCLGGLIGLFIGYLLIQWGQRRKAKRAAGSHT